MITHKSRYLKDIKLLEALPRIFQENDLEKRGPFFDI